MLGAAMCLSLCHGCLHHRLAIVVLLSGGACWVDDECDVGQRGAGRRLACDVYVPRWRRRSGARDAESEGFDRRVGGSVQVVGVDKRDATAD